MKNAPITIVLGMLLASNMALAKIYKWTDEKGVTHYSERPASDQVSEVIKPKTGHSDPVDYAVATSASAASTSSANTQPAQAKPVKDPERCAAARRNQETLRTSARIQVQGDNGEYYYLSPAEIQQKINETNQAVDESC